MHLSRVNKIIRILVYSDFLIISGFGLLGPIFAVFLKEELVGGSLKVAGFASAIYWIVKSIFQLPIASWLDKTRGEKDDFYALLAGSLLLSIAPFFFIIARNPLHVYIIQGVLGLGAALSFGPWYGIFTRHVDKFMEGFEWSLHSVAIGVGITVTSAFGGIIAEKFGYDSVFIMVGVISVLGALLLIPLYYRLRRDIH